MGQQDDAMVPMNAASPKSGVMSSKKGLYQPMSILSVKPHEVTIANRCSAMKIQK
jgi:hypothetical protein